MSSLDKYPDWSAFSERKLPPMADLEILSPALEMASLLQRYAAEKKSGQQEAELSRSKTLGIAAQQAVYVFQLAAALERYEPTLAEASLGRVHRHLRVIKDQMLSALEQGGLQIASLSGMPFEEVVDIVEIEGWRHHEQYTAEVVAEVLEPAVFSGGKLVRLGRVVMGSPLDKAVIPAEPAEDSVDR